MNWMGMLQAIPLLSRLMSQLRFWIQAEALKHSYVYSSIYEIEMIQHTISSLCFKCGMVTITTV